MVVRYSWRPPIAPPIARCRIFVSFALSVSVLGGYPVGEAADPEVSVTVQYLSLYDNVERRFGTSQRPTLRRRRAHVSNNPLLEN